ncbi:cilia- and flagella-associated protein 299-like [Odontomachus brunneus]|uniref:cilia- and flagella-associated protein 299-like n=1 Tax=Odontomachus brunneus TaxID=486640 RepID=UPI0013F194CC|nr:cilia- and flagella-associated protein 299-like [Odontomachus brunneus]
MTVIGTRIDSDRRLLEFQNYEDYLDSLVSSADIYYLKSSKTARQLAELGYRCTGETLSEESFYRRSRIVRNLLFPVHRPYVLTSEFVKPSGKLMEELALRERSNRLNVLSTVIFLRHLTKRSQFEESAYIDFGDRLEKENWLPYYRGERRLLPRKRDLAYYHWRLGKARLNESRNYLPIVDPERGLLLKNIHDRQMIIVDPAVASPGVHTTRIRIHCPFYEHVILYDHVVRSKISHEN